MRLTANGSAARARPHKNTNRQDQQSRGLVEFSLGSLPCWDWRGSGGQCRDVAVSDQIGNLPRRFLADPRSCLVHDGLQDSKGGESASCFVEMQCVPQYANRCHGQLHVSALLGQTHPPDFADPGPSAIKVVRHLGGLTGKPQNCTNRHNSCGTGLVSERCQESSAAFTAPYPWESPF
ncbi:hypothetical protein N657DRAFT_133952 [Parathielavia appendiculata]|uniref:Uncharacterized protein n=1 Tax=Parathielavia appendiculata TaxID=2587402 RepID=A0AAN6TW62_9PEZI|nr:hypothetical protein N657DRAFT_133952 [Parathielavia appendiculata]